MLDAALVDAVVVEQLKQRQQDPQSKGIILQVISTDRHGRAGKRLQEVISVMEH